MFRKWLIRLVLDILSEWQYEKPFAKAKAYYRADKNYKERKLGSFIGLTSCGQDFEVDYKPRPSHSD